MLTMECKSVRPPCVIALTHAEISCSRLDSQIFPLNLTAMELYRRFAPRCTTTIFVAAGTAGIFYLIHRAKAGVQKFD